MDQNRFDAWTRVLTSMPSRRQLLRGLATAGLGLGVPWLTNDAEGKKRRKKKKQAKPNAYGCLEVGAACRNAEQCCSGMCAGKKGQKRCRAHDVGNCRAGQSIGFCGGMNAGCAVGGGNPTGVCGTTTGNVGFCVGGGDCYPCTEDAQCRPFCGAGAACVRCEDCTETGGTMCASAGIHICEFA